MRKKKDKLKRQGRRMLDRRAALIMFLFAGMLSPLFPAAALKVEAPPAISDWRPLPLWGGDVRTLAIDPTNPDVILAGTSAGQVYISQTGGGAWQNAGVPLPFPGWVVSALRFDPNRPARLWVALWG